MTKEQLLKNIFENDPFGLLTLKPKTNQRNADERLIASFQLIVDFYEENSREPEFSKIDIQECNMYYELKSLRQNTEKVKFLKDVDIYGLLENKNVIVESQQLASTQANKKEINSIEDIFDDDSFGILDSDESVFEIKNITLNTEKEKTDFFARRKPCTNFSKYEPLFIQCHKDLKESKRKLIKFNESDIRKGGFFIVDGMLAYVSELNKITRGKHSKLDGRINCIFENGTESNLLFRSLGKALFKNGQSVSELVNDKNLILNPIVPEDLETGYIYVLKSKSNNPTIKAVPNLYKIGFSTVPVQERIKNAAQEPTYLMADVQIVNTYRCYNINPQKFENFIHNFFSKVCLSIDIYDNNRSRHIPREWFSVPLSVIDQTINLIITDKIKDYRYNEENESLALTLYM